MKYAAERKQTIILYILKKIKEKAKNLSKTVSETFDISPNTVHTYLNELIENNIIIKEKRGEYSLISTTEKYTFKRSEGQLTNDTLPYDICLEGKIKHLSENVQRIWLYGLSEMVNNVIDHSNAENMNLIVIQDYLTTSVLLIDDGVGIFEKLKNHFNFSSLNEAICELFKGKLTTDEKNHSGQGIFFTSKMMDYFLIYSDGKIFTASKLDNNSILDANKISQGTCVIMELSNFTHKTTVEIFDQYSDVDNGFTTTKIPLKNIFEGDPVSRSQARMLCNRLEQFTEAILDFDEIKWMGQGFAHQIFVVFKNSHPDISIVPQNMNDSVQSMYNHVIKTN